MLAHFQLPTWSPRFAGPFSKQAQRPAVQAQLQMTRSPPARRLLHPPDSTTSPAHGPTRCFSLQAYLQSNPAACSAAQNEAKVCHFLCFLPKPIKANKENISHFFSLILFFQKYQFTLSTLFHLSQLTQNIFTLTFSLLFHPTKHFISPMFLHLL